MPSCTVNPISQQIILHTPELEMAWSLDNGMLQTLRYHDGASVVGYGVLSASLDVALGERDYWLTKWTFVRYLSHIYEAQNGIAKLVIVLGLGPLKLYDRFEIIGLLIARQVRIENVSPDPLNIHGLRLLIPGARIGSSQHCYFEAPGNSVRPSIPLAVAAKQQRGALPQRFFAPGLRGGSAFEPASTVGPGLLVLHNTCPTQRPDDYKPETLLCWYAGKHNVALPFVEGDTTDSTKESAVILGHEIGSAGRLQSDQSLTSSCQHIVLIRQPWPEALQTFRQTLPLRGIFPADDPVDWLRNAAIYETHPAFFGGFQRMIDALPYIVDLGFTTVLLLPIWDFSNVRGVLWDGNWVESGNPYAICDFDRIDPTLGTAEELRALIRAAHQLGLQVLFDFVVRGCATESRYMKEHPDWFIRDETGAFVVPTYPGTNFCSTDCYSFDIQNLDLQAYLYDWAVRQIQDYDIDGYRTIAPYTVAFNWSRHTASHTNAATLSLLPMLRQLRHDLRRIKPNIALICDLPGPIYSESHDAAYDYLIHHMFIHTALQRMTPAELGAYLSAHSAILPSAGTRVCFIETRDTADVNPLAAGLRGSRISRMLLAGMIFCGFIPSLWMGQAQDEEQFIQTLLRMWRENPVLQYGRTLYNAVSSDSPYVFSVVRITDAVCVFGLIHFSPHKRVVTLNLPIDMVASAEAQYHLRELLRGITWSEGEHRTWSRDDLCQLRLTLEPFGAYCLALEKDTVA